LHRPFSIVESTRTNFIIKILIYDKLIYFNICNEFSRFTLGKLRSQNPFSIYEYMPNIENRHNYSECRRRLKEILDSREYWKKASQSPGWILETKHLQEVAEELLQRKFESLLEKRSQFCVWLGQAKEKMQMEMEVEFVRMLVNQKGMQENDAKALAFFAKTAGNSEIEKEIYNGKHLAKKFRKEITQTLFNPYFIEETAHWPQLRTLNEFGNIFGRRIGQKFFTFFIF